MIFNSLASSFLHTGWIYDAMVGGSGPGYRGPVAQLYFFGKVYMEVLVALSIPSPLQCMYWVPVSWNHKWLCNEISLGSRLDDVVSEVLGYMRNSVERPASLLDPISLITHPRSRGRSQIPH